MALVRTAPMNFEKLYDRLKSEGWDDSLIMRYYAYYLKNYRKYALATKGRTTVTDAQISRVYKSEWAFEHQFKDKIRQFETEKDAQMYTDKVLKSVTWKKVLHRGKDRSVSVAAKKKLGGNQGLAFHSGKIYLNAKTGMNEYVLLHELAHAAGYMHHDASFVDTLLKLVRRFMGKEAASALLSSFKDNRVKTKIKVPKLKSPKEWLVYHDRMAHARSKKGKGNG